MRDREMVDSELRLLAAVRQVCRETRAICPVDELLDERNELTGRRPYPNADT